MELPREPLAEFSIAVASVQVYDEALALSERMLGYESDAILADAFVRTAIGHNLFSELSQPLLKESGTRLGVSESKL